MTATITEVIGRVRDMLDEQTPSQWQNNQIRRWLNEGLNDVARETRAIKDRATFNTVASTAEYTLAANILEVDYAYFTTADGRLVPLTPVAYDGADQVWGQYQNQTSTQPAMFTIWGFPPTLKMRLYPVPTTVSAISLMIARTPTQIDPAGANDATNIDFPEAWIDTIQDYIEYRALAKDRDQRWQDVFMRYTQKRDSLKMNDYINVNGNITIDPRVVGGVPSFISDWGWRY